MGEYFPVPDIETLPPDPLAESLWVLNYSEEILNDSFKNWLDSRSPESIAQLQSAKDASASAFDRVTDLLIRRAGSPYKIGEELVQLRTVYEDLVELRQDWIVEHLPTIEPKSVTNHHHLRYHLNDYIKSLPAENLLKEIKGKYRYELFNYVEFLMAAVESRRPEYCAPDVFSPNRVSQSQTFNKKLGILATVGLVLGAGILLNSRFKNRLATETE